MIFAKIKAFFKHHFVPHEGNNFRAKLLHPQYFVYYFLVLLLFQYFFGFVRIIRPEILGYATDITIEKLLVLINKERQKNNLQPLQTSEELNIAASRKAADMFSKDYWAHISPTGTTPWEFIVNSGYQYLYAGENLAKNFDNSESVVTAWMNSPSHTANILKPEYTDIGLSVMNGKLKGEETTLVVQEFGAKVALAKPAVGGVKPIKQIVPASNPEVASVPQVASQKITNSNLIFILSPKNISLLVAEIMLVVLFIDSIFMWKYKYPRIGGYNIAHIIFFLSLIIAMGATGVGVIL